MFYFQCLYVYAMMMMTACFWQLRTPVNGRWRLASKHFLRPGGSCDITSASFHPKRVSQVKLAEGWHTVVLHARSACFSCHWWCQNNRHDVYLPSVLSCLSLRCSKFGLFTRPVTFLHCFILLWLSCTLLPAFSLCSRYSGYPDLSRGMGGGGGRWRYAKNLIGFFSDKNGYRKTKE